MHIIDTFLEMNNFIFNDVRVKDIAHLDEKQCVREQINDFSENSID